jgi:xeroderma pigmentosum group C-complementing protein
MAAPSREQKKITNKFYLWLEVFCEEEEKWITIDVLSNKVHCLEHILKQTASPISYVLAWNNDGSIKDVSARYCKSFNTATKKLRVEDMWLDRLLKPFKGKRTARDILEDKKLVKIQQEQPLPKCTFDSGTKITHCTL